MTTAYNEGHISTYLDYIDFPAELRLPNVPRDYHFLDTLHKHQISRIPYENLSLHYSTTHTNSLHPAVLFDKFTNHRGGYCMEQTIFYRHMLRALGFHAYTAGARVRLRKNNIPQGDYIGWVHCVNIVTLDDGRRYSCDVGFGGDGPTKPLLISETESQTLNLGPQEVRLHYEALPGSSEPTHKQWIYQYRNSPEQAWNSYYAFPEFEFFDADLSNMNYWTSQSPDSFQKHQTLAVRFLREGTEIVGKVMLADGLVKRNMGGKTELIQECKTEKERIQALDQYFGIRLSQEQIDGIKGTRTELVG